MKAANITIKGLNGIPRHIAFKMPDNKDRDFVCGYINEHFPECEITSINIIKAK